MAKIIKERPSIATVDTLGKYQAEFRRISRRMTIFSLSKNRLWISIDFKQPYNSIIREKMHKTMR